MPTSPRCLLTFVDSECHGRLQKLDSSLSFLLGADAVANLSGSSGSTGPPARPSGSTEPPIATSAGPSSSSSGTSFSSPPQVFLSYNWDIQLKVAQLKERLEQRGITCWMDRPNVGLGDELRGTIAHGITNCKVFISCLTKKYCYSDMCQREAKLASERKKHIVPLLFEDLGSWPPQDVNLSLRQPAKIANDVCEKAMSDCVTFCVFALRNSSYMGTSNNSSMAAFRETFAKLHELRSLAPDIKMLALTATATTSTRETITEMLLMDNPHVIYENPCKTNIAYSVHYMDKERLVGDCFQWLADELKEKKEKTTITIVYCQTIKQCCLIYSVLKGMHGRELYSNSADDPGHVLLEMLHSCTPVKNKDTVLYAFQKEESPVRVLVATIAFVMGVDCKGVHRTIHFGPSNNIEAYIQETGRSGRDGKQSVACLIYTDREFEDEFREDWNDLLNDESLFELAIENLSLSQLEASTCAELSCELHDESGKFEVPAAALDLLENISISE
ncbi:Bloom syndrome protein-like [Stylophora pistillata]|uniref:DNA 3'-5' helicase n=1 Tax=Stylophora pistillata TaxID=50429 RepID=A0A2B4SRU6_STYPI|nr:Bloom syndrome protein-like [Stylophora pistillata]